MRSLLVTPLLDTPESRSFTFEARGSEIVLRFRPRFYQKHRGLAFFEPWTYRVWPGPVVGWCSWFAFFDRVTEQDVRGTAEVMAEVLAPFGYEYLQVDDGYQRASGLPELWLTPNQKFPSGLPALAASIKGRGLRPGIWTNATFSQTDYAQQHREQFVLDDAGNLARGNSIDHPVDASAPGALEAGWCSRSTGRCARWAGSTSSSTRCGTSATRVTTATPGISTGWGWPIRPGAKDDRVPFIRETLSGMRDLPLPASRTSPVYDPILMAAVARFQERHGIPVNDTVNAATLKAMSVPVEKRIEGLRANLERARWFLRHAPAIVVILITAGAARWIGSHRLAKRLKAIP